MNRSGMKTQAYTVLFSVLLLPMICEAQASQQELKEYMARSLALRNLHDLNELLHLNEAKDVSTLVAQHRAADLFTEGCKVDLNIFDKNNNAFYTERYANVSPTDLEFHFEDDFHLATKLHPPLAFQGLDFSDLYTKDGVQQIDLTGSMDFIGHFEDPAEETITSHATPFFASFVISFDGERPTSVISKFEAAPRNRGWVSKANNVSTFKPWKLHEEETFLDPFNSPFCDPAFRLCDPERFGNAVRPILKWEQEQAVFEKIQRNISGVLNIRNDAARASAELFLCLPYYLPAGSKDEVNRNRYKGTEADAPIIGLLISLEKTPEKLIQEVISILSDTDDNDPLSVQASMVRAWYYVLHDKNLTSAISSLEKAAYYPTLKEIPLMEFFAYVDANDYDKAAESIDRFNLLSSNAVVHEHLKGTYATNWYEYGRKMHQINAHQEAMRGYFIGAFLDPDPHRLETLAQKARKLGHEGIALSCYKNILTSGNAANPAQTWLDLANVQGTLGLDPADAITRAQQLAGQDDPLAYSARARYMKEQGQITEATAELEKGLDQWKGNADLLQVLGGLYDDPMKQKNLWLKYVRKEPAGAGSKYFKDGFVNHWIADHRTEDLTEGKRKTLYKEGIQQYKLSARKGYRKQLVYRKIARAYVMLDEMEEAANYYKLANSNGNNEASTYFARAILNVCMDRLNSLDDNLKLADENGITALLDDKGTALHEFLWNLADANTAMRQLKNSTEQDDVRKDQVNVILTSITDRATRMENSAEPGKAYARFSKILVDILRGYNERDTGDKKLFKGTPLESRDVIEALQEHSNIEPYHLKNLELLKVLRGWNDKFSDEVYPKIANSPKSDSCKYLKEDELFKDEYNYL